MKKIRLPFYSNAALGLTNEFLNWVASHYFISNSRNDFIYFNAGSEYDGQVCIGYNNSYHMSPNANGHQIDAKDINFNVRSTFRVGKRQVSDKYPVSVTFADLFGNYLTREGTKRIAKMVELNDDATVEEADISAFSNWLWNDDMSRFSKEFIGVPYDPFKAEMIKTLIMDSIDKVNDVNENNWDEMVKAVKTSKKENFHRIREITGRAVRRFYMLDDIPAKIESLFELI